ncbi:hypothetical protein IE81DRAFT_315462, partial [Ceraceosorus guamensis]
PQRIVATRLLYRLQHPVPIQVVCKGFTPAHIRDCYTRTNRSGLSAVRPLPAIYGARSQRTYV